ncbi:MAG: N-carbamoyl-D-amino-acid hydrolase [Alphaproteobacteria bacterium]|jgi:predicted amidohydrolase
MSRPITLAGAQLGPIHRADSRASVVKRLMALLRQAHGKGAGLVVFPELALTTFFPRWYMEDQAEVDTWFETEMPGPETKPLFDLAAELKIGFYLGYAEKCVEDGQVHRYNTAILVDRDGKTVGKYRKVHLPGHTKYVESYPWQHLEKRYFEVGNLGFPVWRTMGGVMGMCICNDRRWPETYRVMGMKGAEVVMLGYNTPTANRESNTIEPPHLRMMHNQMSMQMGAYQNGTWVVGVAKAGAEDGFDMMGGSVICAPSGEIVAMARTVGDELIVVDADLDECTFNKTTIFNFAAHRRPEAYGIITAQAGVTPPPEE